MSRPIGGALGYPHCVRGIVWLSVLPLCATSCRDLVIGETPNDGDAGSAATDGTGGSSGDGSSGALEPPQPVIPAVTGNCPDFFSQINANTIPSDLEFAAAGIDPRTVRIWMDESIASLDGPLVFYWHGTGGDPNEAIAALSQEGIDAIVKEGGMVVAPFSGTPPEHPYPWFLSGGTALDDLILGDEIIGCAAAQVGLDQHRIHSVGFSAGAVHSIKMTYWRDAYVASVVSYSGGLFVDVPPATTPGNVLAAMVIHGNATDIVDGFSFPLGSAAYVADLQSQGRFGLLCDHEGPHVIPSEMTAPVVRFLADHPWGSTPSSYSVSLPAEFPDGLCSVP